MSSRVGECGVSLVSLVAPTRSRSPDLALALRRSKAQSGAAATGEMTAEDVAASEVEQVAVRLPAPRNDLLTHAIETKRDEFEQRDRAVLTTARS